MQHCQFYSDDFAMDMNATEAKDLFVTQLMFFSRPNLKNDEERIFPGKFSSIVQNFL